MEATYTALHYEDTNDKNNILCGGQDVSGTSEFKSWLPANVQPVQKQELAQGFESRSLLWEIQIEIWAPGFGLVVMGIWAGASIQATFIFASAFQINKS